MVFFTAIDDSSGTHLMLRRLAIANASWRKRSEVQMATESEGHQPVNVSAIKTNADFQNISSYILPDAYDILSPRLSHLSILGNRFIEADLASATQSDEPEVMDDLGIPLLLPLSMALELEQETWAEAMLNRSVSVSVDPVSIVLGNEDLQLVRTIVAQWSSKVEKSGSKLRWHEYEAEFQSQKLGLGLHTNDGLVVVDSVKEPALSLGVLLGDRVHSIDGSLIEANAKLVNVVDKLAQLSRPLTVTFLRPETEGDVDRENCGERIQEESSVSMDVSFASAILTFVEKEVPLLRGEVVAAKVGYGMKRGPTSSLRLSFASAVAIYCYNLSIWGWEPVVEQGRMTFTAELQDPEDSARQLAVEFGDGQDGLALNVTDAAAETLSKVIDWGRRSAGDQDDDGKLEEYRDGIATEDCNKTSVSRNAANAALLYARRKRHGSARPFVFRNRTGLSAAVVQQRRRMPKTERTKNAAFLAVGDYTGLDIYDPAQITVVGNGEDFTFRVDVGDDVTGEDTSPAKFPTLTVSLQTIGGIAVDPLADLQIHRPGETLLPLRYHPVEDTKSRTGSRRCLGQQLAVWRVEQAEEKTVMTLGSSMQVLSTLSDPIQVWVRIGSVNEHSDDEEARMNFIGTAYPGQSFCLPLWLEMQDESWSCRVKFNGEHRSSLLFHSGADSYDFGPLSCGTIGFERLKENGPSVWLATSLIETNGLFTITLGSLFSLRNLLPTEVNWEISDKESSLIDGSAMRQKRVFGPDLCHLRSGEKVEVLAKAGDGHVARFKPKGIAGWSQWVSLSLKRAGRMKPTRDSTRSDNEVSQQELVTTRYAQGLDSFGIPQTIGVKISEKECGFDVVVFAELWCINYTPLNVVFGAPREQGQIKTQADLATMVPTDLTAAEAALKEISSLFESGQDGKGLRQDACIGPSASVDRLAGQGTKFVTEECFEYVDTVNPGPLHQWWATEDPFCKTANPTIVEGGDSAGWFWMDPDWVSSNHR